MRSVLMLLAIMALATLIVGFSVKQMPYFPGDVAATRWIQAQSGSTAWATGISRLAASPSKYFVMGLTIGLAFALAGWRGAALAVGVIAVEQYGAESHQGNLLATPALLPPGQRRRLADRVFVSVNDDDFLCGHLWRARGAHGADQIEHDALAAAGGVGALARRGCDRASRGWRALAERRDLDRRALARLDLGSV